jgi:manganese/iron transport system permease protein/iron/zinc/copper transport system permease protein
VTELLEPFAFGFFRQGIVVALLAGALCGLVGTFVVLRGMSYIGHGLSHAAFGGAVASFVLGVNFYIGAGLWGLLSALLIQRVARRRAIGADAAIGVVTTASFAIGIAIISRSSSFTRNFDAALFGNVLGVSGTDLLIVTGVMAFTIGVIVFNYRPLLFTTFDAEVAEVSGVRTARFDALLAVVLAASIIATMRILGVTLIAAALVIPPAIARMLTDSFSRMLVISSAIGAITGFVGMYASYHLDVASGATIVLVSAFVFTVVFIATGRRRRGGLGALGV